MVDGKGNDGVLSLQSKAFHHICGGVIITLSYLMGSLVYSVQLFRLSIYFGEGKSQIAMYVLSYLVQAAGLGFYILAYRRSPGIWGSPWVYPAIAPVFLFSITGIYLLNQGVGVLACAIAFNAAAALGQGYYFVLLAGAMNKRSRIFVYTAGYSAASILSSALIRAGGGAFLFHPSSILLFALFTVCAAGAALRCRPPRRNNEDASPLGCRPPHLGLIVCIVVVMWILHAIGDASVAMQYSADMSYLFRKGMYAVGLMAAALVFSKSRRTGELLTVLSLLYPLIVPALREDSLMAFLEYSLLWIFTGILSVYRFTVFAEVADISRRFLYLAPLGLLLERLTMAACIGASALFHPSDLAYMATTVVLFAALVLLFLKLRYSHRSQSIAPSLKEFAQRYSLTPREAEVLAKMLQSDRSVKELAAQLYISERVLYRHLESIYKKTGAGSRMGLILLYYGKNAVLGKEERN